MTLSEQIQAWRAAAPGFLERQRKTVGQARYGWAHPRTVAFVFGCQRSGTKMLMRVLDRSPATRIFHENNALAFHDFQLRPDPILRALVAANPAPSQIFKPICNGQEADAILARFPDAVGLWTYRRPDDVANSAVQKWGGHQREVVAAVATGDLDRWGWRTALLPPEIVEDVRRVYRPDLSDHEGALLFWYLRNAFFFTLGLDHHPRMLLVRYEDLVREPERAFQPVFDHVGARFDPGFLDKVHSGSIRRRDPAPASPEIRALCEGLLARLDAVVDARPAAPTPVSPVLMLINTLGVGGAEKYVVTVSNWLVEHGAKVSVVSEPGELVAELHPAVRHHEGALGRVRGDLPRAALAIRRILDEERPAVVVTHSLAMTWVARVAGVGRGIPVVNVAHGWPADRYRSVGPLMRAADRVVAVSPEVQAKLVEGGLDAARSVVIHNGVDCRGLGPRTGAVREAVRASFGAGPEDVLVVTVGRLEAQKAHQHVITLAVALRERRPEVRFAIVGTGDRADELAALAREAGVADRVCLPGLRSDVGDILGSADLYLSCSDWEGMPLSTIEAMASGLPTVATRTEGSAQLLDERSGIVVDVGDTDAMAAAVQALAADADRRAAMGSAAAARARASFSHERMAGELAAVLAAVCRP